MAETKSAKAWQKVETLAAAFAHVVGKRVVSRATRYDDVPDRGDGVFAYGWDDFVALEFEDGAWLAIESSPGEPGYSEMTPASPGYTYVYLYTPPNPNASR